MRIKLVTWSILAILGGCAPARLALTPDVRTSIRILPLEDLTGGYVSNGTRFDSLSLLVLQDTALGQTILNMNDDVYSGFYMNPFRIVGEDDSAAELTLRGEVEQISYGNAETISGALQSYAIGGLLGLALLENSKGMAASVQYRFYEFDRSGMMIDSLLIVGASEGDPIETSRRLLTSRANSFAACSLGSELLKRFRKHTHYDVPRRGRVAWKPEDWERKYSQ